MRKMRFILPLLTAVAVLSSCNEKGKGIVETSFEINMAQQDNCITVTIVPSENDAVYITGLVMEDDWTAFGGSDGLLQYINDQIAQGAELSSGTQSRMFEDLFWQTKYYTYAAQVNEGAVIGTPVWEESMTYRPYVTFAPENVIIGPSAVSDNGRYIVGCSDAESFIYDVRLDSLTVVPNLIFYDVTDSGVVYGTSGPYPLIWENGNPTDVTGIPDGSNDNCFFSVTPDGKTAVGYSMLGSSDMRPVIYENGVLSILPYDLDPEGKDATMAVASDIGSNGWITGYILDNTYMEVGCAWNQNHEYDLYTDELMVWNDGFGYWENIYGGLENCISPNGKYIASWRTNTGDYGWGSFMFAYVFDTETRETYNVDQEAYRPDCVSSQGQLFLSDVTMGYSSVPYVYDVNDNTFSTFADYAKSNYNYSPEGLTMQGSVVAVSEDGKTVVGGYAADETFYTVIYFLPR